MPGVQGPLAFDALFLLPEFPRSAAVVGPSASTWRPALEGLGVEVVGAGDELTSKVDLLVAPAATVPSLTGAIATTLLVEGRVDGEQGREYVALPDASSPALVVDVGRRVDAAAAIVRWGDAEGPRDLARHLALGAAIVGRRVPASASRISVVSTLGTTTPAIVRGLADAGIGRATSWFLVLTRGSSYRRGVFFVRLPGVEGWVVVKFARNRGQRDKFDREEHGLALAARVGGVVTPRAPRSLGRFEVDGYAASAQTAVPGQDLGQMLRGPLPRGLKVRALDRVATWLLDVARTTGGPPSGLAGRWAELRRKVPAAGPLLDGLDGVPSVFVHDDLADGNVLVSARSMHIVDWEQARPDGVPLWDLFYFVVNTLPLLDGVAGLEQNVAYLVALFRGERGPSSALVFRWLKDAVAAIGLDPGHVGRLAMLCWLEHASRFPDKHHWPVLERVADVWHRDPVLGPGWSVWRQ